MTTDITPAKPMLSATQLRDMDLQNAETLLADVYPELIDTTSGEVAVPEAPDEIGDGFSITKDKDPFCGIRALIVNFQFNVGDYEKSDGEGTTEKGEFVTVWLISARGKFKFSDGSTGIYKQLRDYYDRTGRPYLAAPNGLRKSTYDTKDEAGRDIKGTTYYIDTTR